MVLDKSISLRLPSPNLDKLKAAAKIEGLNLNALVNQILAGYLQWDMTASKAGWVVVLAEVIKKLMNELDEKTLYKIAVATADSTKDVRLMMTGDDTIDGFFSILRNRLRKSGISYMESSEKGMIKFIIHHNMGKKWSFFYKVQHERMLQNLGRPATLDFTESTLIINVKIK
ncbi:MAG: hypothetical protein E6L00_07505 [Thaumarchaeota archaeon]|nr:MAG: hypothetical protein E6L02_07210 [Nitrososphaerota archaeon]TLX80445.1 MAG: hypothetical protein E6L00_07505 [Nitrososphaerota archaeon]